MRQSTTRWFGRVLEDNEKGGNSWQEIEKESLCDKSRGFSSITLRKQEIILAVKE
jgi:hypothetical protein